MMDSHSFFEAAKVGFPAFQKQLTKQQQPFFSLKFKQLYNFAPRKFNLEIIPHPSFLIPVNMNTVKNFLFSLIFLAAAQVSQAADSTFIDVKLKGIAPGTAKIVGVFGDQNYIADTSIVDAAGHFSIKREHPLPAGFYTFLLPGQKNFAILMDEDQFFSIELDIADVVNSIKIDGSTCAELFYKNAKFQGIQDVELKSLGEKMKAAVPNSPDFLLLKKRQDEILAERKKHLDEIFAANPDNFFTKFKIAGQNPDIRDFRKANGDLDTLRQLLDYRGHFFDGVDFNDPRLLATPVIANKLRRYIKELVPQHRDSIWAVSEPLIRRMIPHKPYFKFFANWIAMQYENTKTSVMDGEAVYVKIVQTFFTKEFAFWATEKELTDLQKHVWEMEGSLMGKKGQDVVAKDPNGVNRSIYEIQEPLVVIFMFSPDCEHCQKEAPEIQNIYQKWHSRGVQFYGIVLDTDEAKWKAFIKKNGFTFPNVWDPTNRAIYAKYFVDITPELYVLDKNRVIVAKNLKPGQLEEVFEQQFKKMNK